MRLTRHTWNHVARIGRRPEAAGQLISGPDSLQQNANGCTVGVWRPGASCTGASGIGY
jgi:hypothetical protein